MPYTTIGMKVLRTHSRSMRRLSAVDPATFIPRGPSRPFAQCVYRALKVARDL